MVRNYNGENIESLEGIYLLDFYADWCGPCKMLGPVLETLENVNVIKINVDEQPELAKNYKVMSIPNMFIIKNGQPVKQLIGFRSKEEIEEEIKNLK